MLAEDSLANVLYIDLSRKRFWVQRRTDLFDRFLGGAGVATQLLSEECPQEADPLSEDNPIVMAVGPLTGLFPLASKTVAMFKSPLTGNLGESHCGGRSAIAIRLAGYGAIDEYLQGQLGRSADVMDFLSDLLGIGLGLGILTVFSFWSGALAVCAIFIFAMTNLSNQ